MAIVLENGVSLPDIPSDILNATPYIIIVLGGSDYIAVTSTDVFLYDGSSMVIGTFGSGSSLIYTDTEWELGTNYTEGAMQIPLSEVQPIWANHNIYEITGVDPSTGEAVTGDLYFEDCSVVYEYADRYHAPGEWYNSIANNIRELTGVVKRYTIDDMLTTLTSFDLNAANTSVVLNKISTAISDAVFVNGIWYNEGYNTTLYSLDNGKSWLTIQISGYLIASSITFNNGVYISEYCYNKKYGIARSVDGINWSTTNITDKYEINCDFKYANGIWNVNLGETIDDYVCHSIYYSTDNGITWTKSNVADMQDKPAYTILYLNGIWIANIHSAGLYYSEDGITWTKSNTGTPNRSFYAVGYIKGTWFATLSTKLYYSADGKTWTETYITRGGDFNEIAYGNGMVVAGYRMDKGLCYSEDGKTWTQSNLTTGTFGNIKYINGIWVAGSNNGMYYSEDGKTWTQSNLTTPISKLIYGDGLLIVNSSNMDENFDIHGYGAYYSTNGTMYTQIPGTGTDNMVAGPVAYGNGVWFLSGLDNTKLYYWKYATLSRLV